MFIQIFLDKEFNVNCLFFVYMNISGIINKNKYWTYIKHIYTYIHVINKETFDMS